MKRTVTIGGGVVGAWAAWHLFGPDWAPSFREPQVRPIEIPGRSVFVEGRELFVREVGPQDAPPLVLLHGLGFDGEMVFHRIIPTLAREFRLIVPDHRGHGKSDPVRGRFEIEDLAEDLAGVLDVIGFERGSILGYSMGGMVAQVFAARHPERVDALVFGASAAAPFPGYGEITRPLFWLARGVMRLTVADQVGITYAYLRRVGAVDRRHGRWMWEAMMARDATLYFDTLAAVRRFDGRALVARLDMPTLVVVTASDPMIRPRAQRQLAGLLDGQTVEIPGAGHEAIMTHPDVFVDAIEGFLGAHGVPARS